MRDRAGVGNRGTIERLLQQGTSILVDPKEILEEGIDIVRRARP